MPPVEDAEHQEAEGEAVPLQHALDVLLEAAADVDEPEDYDDDDGGDDDDDDDSPDDRGEGAVEETVGGSEEDEARHPGAILTSTSSTSSSLSSSLSSASPSPCPEVTSSRRPHPGVHSTSAASSTAWPRCTARGTGCSC